MVEKVKPEQSSIYMAINSTSFGRFWSFILKCGQTNLTACTGTCYGSILSENLNLKMQVIPEQPQHTSRLGTHWSVTGFHTACDVMKSSPRTATPSFLIYKSFRLETGATIAPGFLCLGLEGDFQGSSRQSGSH